MGELVKSQIVAHLRSQPKWSPSSHGRNPVHGPRQQGHRHAQIPHIITTSALLLPGDRAVFPLTLTATPPFSFLDYLLGKGGVKQWGFPLGFEPGTSRTTMHCSPMARHSGVAALAAISFPYETYFYDVIGLNVFSHFPLLDFVGLWTVRVRALWHTIGSSPWKIGSTVNRFCDNM